ncbi:MAG: LuxR C-terminal-related transcriptional regulator [Gaiellaceae bacterium]
MTDVSEPTAHERAEAGWAALAAGEWARARTAFEDALAGGETPDGFEGLSWAAWWLDDADAVFGARERAYRLYKRAGDAASAARMAAWLAADELDFHGAAAVAGAWLQRANRLLEPLDVGAEHGWLAFFEGYIAKVRGDDMTAAERGAHAAELGRRLGVPDLEMLGLALEGAALVSRAHVDEGMRYLDEATAVALEGDATIPICGAWACCFLVTACSAARDFERAFEWCDRIAEFAERYGSRYMLAFCRAEYGAVHLWRGRWLEAEAVLEASIEDFSRSRPAMIGGALVALAELRRRQGRPVDAAGLLERAGGSPSAQLCRAGLALDEGDTRGAVELSERVLRRAPEAGVLAHAPALELLARARVARGELEEAATAVGTLREVEQLVGTTALTASVDLAEGMLEAALGDHDRARRLLEDAADGFDRCGAPFEAAGARIELASTLLALDRGAEAKRESRVALDRLRELGASAEAKRAQRLLESLSDSSPVAELTKRELQVVGLLADGLTNRQIAETLVVSEHTVHRHVTNILRKLDLPSRTAAAAHAVRSGLLERAGS